MASSNKTDKLGLSLWESTDRPERMDFVKDNEILDQALGEHLANSLIHFSANQKSFLELPFWFERFSGTSSSSRSSTVKALPKLIVQMCIDYPPVVPRSDGKLDVYWDFLYTDNENYTSTFSLGGIGFDLKNNRWVAYSRTSPTNSNLVMHMNDTGVKYVTLFLPIM